MNSLRISYGNLTCPILNIQQRHTHCNGCNHWGGRKGQTNFCKFDEDSIPTISIKEPWISMIANRQKTIETRTWTPDGKYFNKYLLFAGSKKPEGPYSGIAACVACISSTMGMFPEHEERACCEVYPNAKSWFLTDIHKVRPFSVIGQLKFYEVKRKFISLDRNPTYAKITPTLMKLCWN